MTRADAAQKRELYCELLDHYGPALSGRCKDVLELYYEEDLSLSEIAENCGITRQGVLDAIRRGEGDLLLLEEKLRFAEKSRAVLGLAGELKSSSSDPEKVGRLADAIAETILGETEGD